MASGVSVGRLPSDQPLPIWSPASRAPLAGADGRGVAVGGPRTPFQAFVLDVSPRQRRIAAKLGVLSLADS